MTPETERKTATILIVDDMTDNLNLLTNILTEEGYHIIAVTTGTEALSSIQKSLPDLILLDIKLPDISGLDICRYLRTGILTRDIPVIFMSALDEINDKITGFNAGGVDYITKPFYVEEVLARVRTHINLRQMHKTLDKYAMELKEGNERLLLEISVRKAAEDIIASERELLSVTLQGIGDGVITTDISGNVIIMNKIAEKLTGWSQDEAKGKPAATVFNIIHELSRKTCESPVTKVLASGRVMELENNTVLISRSGTEYIIADSGAPIFDKNNIIIGVVLVFRDITEKQKLIETMQHTDKLESLGVLAGGIAHDFNNLLTGIFGYIEFARKDIADESTAASYLDKALSVFDHAKYLTRQLITFSKGGDPIRKTGDLGEQVKKTVSFTLSGANVACKYHIPNDLWQCDFDENQIGQVVGNIIINAKQAMPKGGNVVISLENIVLTNERGRVLPAGRYIKLSIADNGIGISPEIIKHIFDPFFTTKEAGSGLGLATSYSIIRKHEGYIDVSSMQGKGSVFHIYLPASDKEGLREEINITSNHRGNGQILIMDDEPFILEILENRLKMMGYSVLPVVNGEEALSALEKAEKDGKPIAAAIFDLTIPGGMGGAEAITLLRQKYPYMPVFASSGYSEDPAISNPKEFGFTGSISKPFGKNTLASLLDRHMNK